MRITTAVLGTACLFFSNSAIADPVDAARQLISDAERRVYSFDVQFEWTQRTDVDASGGEINLLRQRRARQVWATGKHPIARQRVVWFEEGSEIPSSIQTYDGSHTRSFYFDLLEGNLSEAPENGSLLEYDDDYRTLLGLAAPGKGRRPFLDLVKERALGVEIRVQDDGDMTVIQIPPPNPKRSSANGYDLSFDKAHGLAFAKMFDYELLPDGDDFKKCRRREISITGFHKVDDIWVPAGGNITRFNRRGEKTSEIEVVVDLTNSRWNKKPQDDLFKFRFPRGAVVTNWLTNTAVRVGASVTEKDLDELTDKAQTLYKFRPEPPDNGTSQPRLPQRPVQ